MTAYKWDVFDSTHHVIMAAMCLGLTICLLVIGLAQSLENISESQVGQLKRSSYQNDKVIFFKAFLSSNSVNGVRDAIVFSDVQHNIGGAYSYSSGVFTAPVTGLYEFKGRVTKMSGDDTEIALFNQNGPRASSVLLRDWETYGISAIMKVEKEEHVYVKVNWSKYNNNVTLRSGYFNQFTGYLIRQLCFEI